MRPFLPALLFLAATLTAQPIDIGSRRQLFVDDYLVQELPGLTLQLHPPARRETVFTYNAPWEGSGTDFERIIRLGEIIRMYYNASELTYDNGLKIGGDVSCACVAESVDGIHWVRPDLGIFEFHGSRHNNIVWAQARLDNFTPFEDANPASPPEERFKALGFADPMPGKPRELFAYKSADGIHWSHLSKMPLFTNSALAGLTFDTQNNAFWDPVRKQYWCYIRGFHYANGRDVTDIKHGTAGIRDVRVSTSTDFHTWTNPRPLLYPDSPDEALYTNQIEPYYRAPDLFVGFPTRYIDRRDEFTPAAMAALPDPNHRQRRMKFNPRYATVVTDGQFMTSRDGVTFHRWNQPLIPPGPQRSNNWVYGDGYQSLGLLKTPADDPTAPPELSCYADEGHWKEGETLRRYTFRIDGFVSLHAVQPGGFCLTKPLVFSGRRLSLNFATSAAGTIRVELESTDGAPLPGFALADCAQIFGDSLARTVSWKGRSDLSSLAGRPIRVRFTLEQADLYSLRFEP